jgi:hypothetical protein
VTVNPNVNASVNANGNVDVNAPMQRAVLVASVEPEPPPTGALSPPLARTEVFETSHRRWGMMAGGISLFAVAYAADAGVTYGFHHDPVGVSLIPVIGPLVQLGDKYGYQGPMPMTGNAAVDAQMAQQIAQANQLIRAVTYTGLVIDFVGQLTGVTLALVGAFTRTHDFQTRVTATGRGLAFSF